MVVNEKKKGLRSLPEKFPQILDPEHCDHQNMEGTLLVCFTANRSYIFSGLTQWHHTEEPYLVSYQTHDKLHAFFLLIIKGLMYLNTLQSKNFGNPLTLKILLYFYRVLTMYTKHYQLGSLSKSHSFLL